MAYKYHKARQFGLHTDFPRTYRNRLLSGLTCGHRPEPELVVTNDAITAIDINPFTEDLLGVACRKGAVFLHPLRREAPKEAPRLQEETSSRLNYLGFAGLKFVASHVACGARERAVEVYDCTTSRARKVKRFQTVSEISAFAANPDTSSPLLAAGLEQGGFEMLDLRRKSSVGEPFLGMEGSCSGLQFVNQYHVVGGSRAGEVLLWDIRMVHKTPLLEFGRRPPVSTNRQAPAGSRGQKRNRAGRSEEVDEAVWQYVMNHERKGAPMARPVKDSRKTTARGRRPRIVRASLTEDTSLKAEPLRFYSSVDLGIKLMSGQQRNLSFQPGRTIGASANMPPRIGRRRHGRASQLERVYDILPPAKWDNGVVYVLADLGVHRYNAADGTRLSFTRFPNVSQSVACLLDGIDSVALANRNGMTVLSSDGRDRRALIQSHIYVMTGLAWSCRLGTIFSCGAEGTVNRYARTSWKASAYQDPIQDDEDEEDNWSD
ncbi:hypothetical protein FOZ62_030476 [Perkinsus olseni]|uniref:Uncharacterized protein n=1 Tax=Perkinsus olseni TaxID=32597 RepID=A0A7J6T180_PEROL|nr:hypothetical protein FOZ62_030476 [Perkinsus olseni]